MRISAINNSSSFTQQKQPSKNDNNPISKSGEKAKLTKAAFIAGLGIGAKLLFEVMDGDFVVDTLGNKAGKIVDKQHRNVSKNKKHYWQLEPGQVLLQHLSADLHSCILFSKLLTSTTKAMLMHSKRKRHGCLY